MRDSEDYKLTIEPREGYLYTRIDADWVSLAMIVATFNEIFAALHAGDYRALLFVRNCPLLSTPENRRLVSALVRNMVPEGAKIAVVDTYPHNSAAEKAAASEATRAAGLDLMTFDSIEEAEGWLLTPESEA